MNEQLLSGIKKYVNMMMGPLVHHYYHHYEHALEVMMRAIEIGQKEGLDDNTLEILAVASLFHDIGFIIQYDNNEPLGAKIAKNYLNSIFYPPEKIKAVEDLIIATIPSRAPTHILESIIRDADTDNLGRDDFFEKGNDLKREIESIKNIKILDPDWTHYSINFLREHTFCTHCEIAERQGKKEENLKKLEENLKKLQS